MDAAGHWACMVHEYGLFWREDHIDADSTHAPRLLYEGMSIKGKAFADLNFIYIPR